MQFTTIFPACYAGRWPHMHFEVYESLDRRDDATPTSCAPPSSRSPRTPATRSTASPTGYDASVSNLDQVSLDSDSVFSDGYSLQLANVTGSVDEGYTFTLNVPV